jgi:hypothetical protein
MVIGIETDEPGLADHPVLGSKSQSFCQWTFMCKPRLPVMMRLIENILVWLSRLAQEQGKSISDIVLNFDEVLNGTGPSAFTTAILAEMSAKTGRKKTWADFTNLEESKVVGKTLVLTSEAFAAGTGHSRSGNHRGKNALVKHHFHASTWTDSHPRYKHPVYGEIEKCNWNVECIRLWDVNTKFFAALPKEDQRKMIEMKDREDTIAKLGKETGGLPAALPAAPMIGPAPAPGPLVGGSQEILGSANSPSKGKLAPLPAAMPAGLAPGLVAGPKEAVGLPLLPPAEEPIIPPAAEPERLTPGLDLGSPETLPEEDTSSKDELPPAPPAAEASSDELLAEVPANEASSGELPAEASSDDATSPHVPLEDSDLPAELLALARGSAESEEEDEEEEEEES